MSAELGTSRVVRGLCYSSMGFYFPGVCAARRYRMTVMSADFNKRRQPGRGVQCVRLCYR